MHDSVVGAMGDGVRPLCYCEKEETSFVTLTAKTVFCLVSLHLKSPCALSLFLGVLWILSCLLFLFLGYLCFLYSLFPSDQVSSVLL